MASPPRIWIAKKIPSITAKVMAAGRSNPKSMPRLPATGYFCKRIFTILASLEAILSPRPKEEDFLPPPGNTRRALVTVLPSARTPALYGQARHAVCRGAQPHGTNAKPAFGGRHDSDKLPGPARLPRPVARSLDPTPAPEDTARCICPLLARPLAVSIFLICVAG